MAFGFSRAAGTSRGYVADGSNPVFAAGQRLSRRQYDKYVEQIGQRSHLPGAEAIRATERNLEALREALTARQTALDSQAAELAARELAVAEREAQAARRGGFLRERQGAGQRRYNLALELYVTREREAGRPVTKRDAAKRAEFKAALADIKGRPNPSRNPNIAADNVAKRRRGFAVLGGADRFKEQYERQYGRVARGRRPGRGNSIRRRNKG